MNLKDFEIGEIFLSSVWEIFYFPAYLSVLYFHLSKIVLLG